MFRAAGSAVPFQRSTWIVMEEKLNSERRSFVAFMRTICVSASSSVDTQTRERFYSKS